MNKLISHTIGIRTVVGLAFVLGAGIYSSQSVAQETTNDDVLVEVGETTGFLIDPVPGASYQWLHNGVAIDGQTNRTLAIDAAQINDAGFYSCATAVGADVVPSGTAYIMVYTITPDLDVVVYGTPITSSGSSAPCPGSYKGYVIYTLASPTWGWAPSTNTTTYTASDTSRSNTKVEYVGAYGDEGCNQTTVTIPSPTFSPVYRFGIYFTNNVPSTNYPITLSGFNP